MKRELKFKAYHKNRNEIYIVHGWHSEFVFSDTLDGIGNNGNPDKLEDVELMQFTGFQDCKGKEIYEGDILSDWVETDDGKVQSKQQVFWNEFTGSWHLDQSHYQDKTFSVELWMDLLEFKYEITRNINDK